MPENLQGGEKTSQLEEVISELETVIDDLDNSINSGVEFPGMF